MTAIDESARDDVLFAFQLAHPYPSPADVRAWVDRHPALADALMEHASAMLDAAREGEVDAGPDESALARGRSVALDLLFRADEASREAAQAPKASFDDLLGAYGSGVPTLSREIGIGRGVLTDLVSGRIATPIGRRLLAALAKAFAVPIDTVSGAVDLALAAPRLGRAKASGRPEARRRPYAEAVSADPTMTDDRKAHWLGD